MGGFFSPLHHLIFIILFATLEIAVHSKFTLFSIPVCQNSTCPLLCPWVKDISSPWMSEFEVFPTELTSLLFSSPLSHGDFRCRERTGVCDQIRKRWWKQCRDQLGKLRPRENAAEPRSHSQHAADLESATVRWRCMNSEGWLPEIPAWFYYLLAEYPLRASVLLPTNWGY